MKTLRIGILGAAAIAPAAVIGPARELEQAEVVAVAARDTVNAEKFARKHNIATVHSSYDALLADANIDAIYNPLPNGLHGHWTIRAVEAGKHVLCEKPFTANADEAREVAAVVQASDRVVMEAFHWRYHALAYRLREIIESGEIGDLQHVRMSMCFPLPMFGDIRWNPALAGGSLMDAGCYAVSITRFLANAEPAVVSAFSKTRAHNIDRYTHANLDFGNGVTGEVEAAMWSSKVLRLVAEATGSRGSLRVINPVLPQLWHRLTITNDAGKRREKVDGEGTYTAQLRAFCDAVDGKNTNLTDVNYAIANMAVIDDIYRKAGLPIREPSKV